MTAWLPPVGIVVWNGLSAAISGGKTTLRTENVEDFGGFVNFVSDELDGRPAGGKPPNPEFEDCSLVLTTSRGHVKIAPVVPPSLELIQNIKTLILVAYARISQSVLLQLLNSLMVIFVNVNPERTTTEKIKTINLYDFSNFKSSFLGNGQLHHNIQEDEQNKVQKVKNQIL